jgi:hypothetical protein
VLELGIDLKRASWWDWCWCAGRPDCIIQGD